DQDGEAWIEVGFTVHCGAFEHEVRVGGVGQDRGPEAGTSYQFADLVVAPASALDRLQRQIEPQAEMPVALPVQLEVTPLEQDGQVFRFLNLHNEHALADRVQNTRRDVDAAPRPHLYPVQQAEQLVDVLVPHQRLEPIDGHVLRQSQVDFAALDDVPRLGLTVRPAEVPARPPTRRGGGDRDAASGG